MPKYVLARNGAPIATFSFGGSNADDLTREEFDALKSLDGCAKFSFELTPKDHLPESDHDVLDDIALEIVASARPGSRYGAVGGAMMLQAKQRVIERGLR
jgi:hypothetical protein